VKHELNQKEECDHKSKPEDALIAYTLLVITTNKKRVRVIDDIKI
jgi:hypothetical protein